MFVTILLESHAYEYRTRLTGTSNKLRAQAAQFIYDTLGDLLERRQQLAGAVQPVTKRVAT